MPNDLATLRGLLSTQLRDTSTPPVWSDPEKDTLLNQAASLLWPKVMKPVRQVVPLVADQEEYILNMAMVNKVDILDDSLRYATPLPGRAWEVWEGDDPAASVTLFMNRGFSVADRSIRAHGYAPYDLTTNLPSDRVVPLILARARAEAYRRMGADRAKFRQWATQAQQQNITMNELIQLFNDADREASILEDRYRTWPKPMPAMQG